MLKKVIFILGFFQLTLMKPQSMEFFKFRMDLSNTVDFYKQVSFNGTAIKIFPGNTSCFGLTMKYSRGNIHPVVGFNVGLIHIFQRGKYLTDQPSLDSLNFYTTKSLAPYLNDKNFHTRRLLICIEQGMDFKNEKILIGVRTSYGISCPQGQNYDSRVLRVKEQAGMASYLIRTYELYKPASYYDVLALKWILTYQAGKRFDFGFSYSWSLNRIFIGNYSDFITSYINDIRYPDIRLPRRFNSVGFSICFNL